MYGIANLSPPKFSIQHAESDAVVWHQKQMVNWIWVDIENLQSEKLAQLHVISIQFTNLPQGKRKNYSNLFAFQIIDECWYNCCY